MVQLLFIVGVVKAFTGSDDKTMIPMMGQKPPTDPMLGPMDIEMMKLRGRNISAPRSKDFEKPLTMDEMSKGTRSIWIFAILAILLWTIHVWRDAQVDESRPTTIIEYAIKAEPPACRNFIQLNGSVKPSWFQGYILVSPFVPGCIRTTTDPGQVLLQGRQMCRPRLYPTYSETSTTNTESSSEFNDSIF